MNSANMLKRAIICENKKTDIIAYDSFNRADNNTTIGIADSGQTWSNIEGGMGILSNKAVVTWKSPGQNSCAVLDSKNYNIDVSCDCTYTDYFGVILRCKDAYNFVVVRMNPASVVLARMVSSATTIISTYNHAPTVGKTYKLKIKAFGNVIKVYLDGVQIISTTCDFFLTETLVGFRYWNTSTSIAVKYDNFVVNKINSLSEMD